MFHPALIVIHKIILQSLWPFPCHPHCIDINQIMNEYKASASLIFFLQSTPWENESNSLRMGNILSMSMIGSPMIASNKTQLQFSIQTTKLTQTNILIHHAIYANTLLHDHILDGYFYWQEDIQLFFVISNLNLSNMFNNTTTTTTSTTKDTISGQPEAIL